jgi:hypothetical protein
MSAPSPAAASASTGPSRTLPRCSPGWSELRRLIFLDVLKRGGAVAAAARATGMSRASAYALRDRDDEFDRRWAAIIDARDKALFNAHVARVDAAAARLTGSPGRRPAARAETLLAHLTHATPVTPATMTPATAQTLSTTVGA